MKWLLSFMGLILNELARLSGPGGPDWRLPGFAGGTCRDVAVVAACLGMTDGCFVCVVARSRRWSGRMFAVSIVFEPVGEPFDDRGPVRRGRRWGSRCLWQLIDEQGP